MLIYIAGPYRGNVRENIAAARKAAIAVWEAGHTAICPHLNTANFEEDCKCENDRYLQGDLDILLRCDYAVFIPGWEESEGAKAEQKFCEAHKIPMLLLSSWPQDDLWAELLPPHPTEVKYPVQCRAWIAIAMRMYRLHLSKNQDYSPTNILGTGQVGTVVRLWDKVARLMNLSGFRITVVESEYSPGDRPPAHESVEDTLLDAANYSIIALLFRRGQWGR